jgi:hypothetical protein
MTLPDLVTVALDALAPFFFLEAVVCLLPKGGIFLIITVIAL